MEATGVELGAILDGLLPGLLLCLCVVAATTTIGAVAGAAIGALGLGIGAVPGAAFGATAGLEAGVALLEGLGLAFLTATIGASVIEASRLARRAVHEAWHAVDEPRWRLAHTHDAGRTLADAAAALVRGVLQSIVAFLFAKGANAAASRVPELVSKLRASKLGEGFATWVERNWASLIDNDHPRHSRPPAREVPFKAESRSDGATAARSSGANKPKAAAPERPSPALEAGGEPSAKYELKGTAANVGKEPILEPEYVNAVAKFKNQSPEEVAAFYDKELAKGIDHRPLIDNALENHPGLTRAEAETIYGYTGKQWYRDFNADLEAGGSARSAELNGLLKSGLDKLPDSTAPTQYRGLRIEDPEQLRAFDTQYAPGKTVEVKSFWSTAPDTNNAYQGSRNLIINTRSAKDISDLSFGSHFHAAIGKTPYSAETIIPPGTRLQVVDVSGDTVVLEEIP